MLAQMSRIHRCGCSGRTGEPELVEKPLGEYAHSATLPPSARVDQIMADIFDILPILDNLAAAGRIARKQWLVTSQEVREAASALRRLSIKVSSLDALPQTLSGGTQQKLLIARWLDLAPKILVLEEPTRGVDIATKRDIYQIIRAVAAAGTIVVWWSTEFSELAEICDHVITFDLQGEVSGRLDGAEISEVAMARATGMAA